MNDELLEEGGGKPLDLKVLVLYGLARSRLIVTFCVLLGTSVGLFFAASQPNTYKSTGRLRLTEGVRERMTAEYLAGLEDSQRSPAMEDEILLLSDQTIYERVAKRLGPQMVLQPADPERYDDDSTPGPIRLMHQLQSALYAQSSANHPGCTGTECLGCIEVAGRHLDAHTEMWAEFGSSVITVSHESTSPERAQAFNNALLEAFVERHREEYQARKHFDESTDKMLLAYDEFEANQDEYSRHIGECGFIDLDTQKETMLQEIGQLKNEINFKKADREAVRSEIEWLTEDLAELPRTVEEVIPAQMGTNPEYKQLRDELQALRTQRIKLKDPTIPFEARGTYDEEFDQQEAAIRELLKTTPELTEIVPEIKRIIPNPEHRELRNRLAELKRRERGLGQAIETHETFRRDKEERLDVARNCDRTHAFLKMRIDDAKKKYDQRFEKQSELEQLVSLEEEGESNLTVFQSAILPISKEGPQRAKLLLMGLAGGIAVGAGLALLRQFLDPRVRYPETISGALSVEVLGVVPEIRSLRKLGKRPAGAS